MLLKELLESQADFTRFARERISGVGAHQYDYGSRQKFESMTFSEIAQGLKEELADVVNYATFLALKVQTLEGVHGGIVDKN